ncbi:MAG: hypothetical protein H6585_01030 [Flavobacteriales bacterium]|nr:hypothetical protein [Flavobacteriales bacterium]MCB9446910.1 hypothetical protein [Flavobacteriales bacterium]
MKFLRRLQFYLIGVFLGCGLVYVLVLRDRKAPAWMPSDIIRSQLDTIPFGMDPKVECLLKCIALDSAAFRHAAATSEIDFSQSQPQADPCPVYRLNVKQPAEFDYMMIRLCEDQCFVLEAMPTKDPGCGC